MIKKSLILSLLLLAPLAYALIVDDVVTPGRVENGSLVSNAEEDPPPPAFGNIQGSGNVTIGWDPVVADDQGQPITLKSYELRIRLVGAPTYTFIAVPPEFTGHALTLSAGDYEGFVEAIGVSGYIATAATFNVTVN